MRGCSRSIVGRGLVAVLLVGLLAGCEGLGPYRTVYLDTNTAVIPICNPDTEYKVPESCRNNIHERSDQSSGSYDLFFTEFSDQGLQFPKDEYEDAGSQINHTLAGLKRISEEPGTKGISVIVFVHGWKHNAKHDDENVINFRRMLQSAASIEQARGSDYRVVGVYVGWRGLSIRGPLSNLSFWSRKDAALRVAQGSPRELFNRLRRFKCSQNRLPAPESGDGCGDPSMSKVRMLMIGHSFGGWILYNALAGSLIESVTHEGDIGAPNTVNMRFADMVVLLNPAFEASRYTPLHRTATKNRDYSRYQAPLLVSVTSSADAATHKAFPIGRFFNTLFEWAANEEEGEATDNTMGHMVEYVTHKLTDGGAEPWECASWKSLEGNTNSEQRPVQAMHNLAAERAVTTNFLGGRTALNKGWERRFCGGAVLRHEKHNPNSVIWNVHTDRTIMNDHNDITRPQLIEFIRQLYNDTLPSEPNVVVPGSDGAK